MVRLLLFPVLILVSAPPAMAQERVSLSLPLRCDMGRTCWIQKYADLADGPERSDYRCGAITTDAHDGVDFRIASLAQMRAGVAVLAAAPGTVVRVRDGEPDVAADAAPSSGKEAGNGVVIDHGDGWETQYSHLMNGSIRVRPGTRVTSGTPLGTIGLSGSTEFPHVHFSVRHAGEKIDPFTGLALPGQCNDRSARALWTTATLATVRYEPGQIVQLAFADAPQSRKTLRLADPRPPGRNDPMVLMAELIGVMTGDVNRFEIRGPDGQVVLAQTVTLERPNLNWVGFAGKKPPAGGWLPGRYRGRLIVTRIGSPERRQQVVFDMR